MRPLIELLEKTFRANGKVWDVVGLELSYSSTGVAPPDLQTKRWVFLYSVLNLSLAYVESIISRKKIF